MRSLLGCLSLFFTLCNCAALPKIPEASFNTLTAAKKDDRVGYTLNSQLERRSTEITSLIVSLELINSGYCGNISVGSQDTSILTLFDLGTSQLSALSSDVQYCANSGQCSPTHMAIHRYDPSLSETATDLTESFEIDVSTTTLSGVIYEDSVSIGGLSISKQSFGLARKVRGSRMSTSASDLPYGGVAGLSGCANSTQSPSNLPSFIDTLFTDGHIQSPGFSLWMNPITLIGEILFGAIDSIRYKGALYLFDLVSPNTGYSIYLEEISSNLTGSNLTFPQVEMTFDTTVSNIVLPLSWKNNMITIFGGDLDQNSTFLVPCASKTSNIDINFVLGNGFTISVPISAFVGAASTPAGMCQTPFSFTDGNRYVLGSSFLQYVYLVLNTKASQGAIAQANFTNSESILVAMTPGDPFPGGIVFNRSLVEVNANSSTAVSDTVTNNGTSTLTTAVLLATTGGVVTETVLTTITESTAASVLTSIITSTATARTVNGLVASASDSTGSAILTTPVDPHLASSSTNTLPITSRTADGLVVSISTSTGPVSIPSGNLSTTSPGDTSRTIAGVVASAGTSVLTGSSRSSATTDSNTSTSTSISRTDDILLVTTPEADTSSTPITLTSPVGTGSVVTDPVSETTKSVEGVNVSGGSSTTAPSRNTNGFNVPFPSTSYSMTTGPPSPWPSGINVNIYIQNSIYLQNPIILTTTHRYAPDDYVDVVTVTSTATVTTTVPCSTDPAKTDTVTARVLQLLVVPSPTPYVDVECSCTKTDIVYVDEQCLTKTIYVQAATPILSPTQQPEPSQCECEECYYTVKRTKTVTAYCTSTPIISPITVLPTFISAGNQTVAVYGCSALFALAIGLMMALLR